MSSRRKPTLLREAKAALSAVDGVTAVDATLDPEDGSVLFVVRVSEKKSRAHLRWLAAAPVDRVVHEALRRKRLIKEKREILSEIRKRNGSVDGHLLSPLSDGYFLCTRCLRELSITCFPLGHLPECRGEAAAESLIEDRQ